MSTDPAFRPDPQNANKGTARGQSFVNRSIRERGAARSGVAAADGTMIAGSQTLGEVAALGLPIRAVHTRGDEWVVVVRDDIEPGSEAARLLAIEDNRSSEVGLSWDPAVLATLDPPLLEGLWRPEELAELLATIPPDVVPGGGGDTFAGEPNPEQTRVAPGDIWQIGPHRLLVGDSTDPVAVDRLFGPARAEMVWADPPYGVAVGDKNKFLNSIAPSNRVEENLTNDTLDEPALLDMLHGAFAQAVAHCLTGGAWYVAAPPGPLHVLFGQALKDLGIWHQTIQWVKNNATFAPLGVDYHWRAEPIFYGWLPGAAHRYYGGRKQDTVWEIDRPMASPEHPTMKPVALMLRAIENSSLRGEIVYDPFLGSGSTLIAAHRAARVCYGLEIEPKYADVVLTRAEAEGIAPITRLEPGAPDA